MDSHVIVPGSYYQRFIIRHDNAWWQWHWWQCYTAHLPLLWNGIHFEKRVQTHWYHKLLVGSNSNCSHWFLMGLKWGNALECTKAVPCRVMWWTVHSLSECASLFWNKTCTTEIKPSSCMLIHTTVLLFSFYKRRGKGRGKQPVQTHTHVKIKIISIAGMRNLVLKVSLIGCGVE